MLMNQSMTKGRLSFMAFACGAAVVFSSPGAAAQTPPAEATPAAEPWYEAFRFRVFADAYASLNANFPKPQPGSNALRALDPNNGFSLSWVGADVSYAPSPIGGTVALRVGPSAERLARTCFSQTTRCDSEVEGLGLVKQAFAAWVPLRDLELDFGKFDSVFGAEVAESQDNLNYTRGALWWLGQPKFHTGLRAAWQIVPELSATALVVNGWNNTLDNNLGKTYGVELGLRPLPELDVELGWMGGPEQDDVALVSCATGTSYSAESGTCASAPGVPAHEDRVNRGGANAPKAWRHLADLVVRYRPLEVLELVLNADYGEQGTRELVLAGTTRTRRQEYFGTMLGARYRFDQTWAVAARGEYLGDAQGLASGISGLKLATGTLTLESKPVDQFVVRLEERADFALDATGDTEIFPRNVRGLSSQQWTTTLGVVVTTR
jgi:hypothetical protein